MSPLPPTSDDTRIWDIWESMFIVPVVTVSDELGVFKALSDAALTTEELAAQLGLDGRALAMLLAALCSQGLIDKRLGRWSATHETRRWLHPEAKGYWGTFLSGNMVRGALHAPLLEAIKTGNRQEVDPDGPPAWERPTMTAEVAASRGWRSSGPGACRSAPASTMRRAASPAPGHRAPAARPALPSSGSRRTAP